MAQPRQSTELPSERSPLLGRDTLRSVEPTDATTGAGGPVNIAAAQEHGTFASNDGAVPESDRDVEQQQRSNADGSSDDPPKPHEGLPEVRKRMHIIFPALAIGIFLGAADLTIIISSYGNIGSELHALNLTSWIATAYFLTLTSFQPLYGKLSDIFGRKPCLLFCYSVFGLGCMGCGLARNITQLIAARAFAGIGGGGINVVVTILMSDIVTLRERGKWQGYINTLYAAGASIGAPLGGLFADRLSWRWLFLFQIPLCLAAIIAVTFALHLPKRPQDEESWSKKLRRIDILGALILICAVFSLLVALDRGSNVSWSAPISYGPLIASAVLAIAFALVETKVAKEPFAPGHLIFSRSTFALYLVNFFGMASAVSAIFYAPLYFQAVGGLTATGAGLRLIPQASLGVMGSLSMGYYMQKTGKYYWATIVSYGLLTVAMTIIIIFSGFVVNSIPGTVVGLCFEAFGNSGGVTTTLIGLLANVAHKDQSLVIACSYLFRSLGCVFGISMSATVANQVLKAGLVTRLPQIGLSEREAVEIADRVRQSLAYLRDLKPDVRAVVANCYQHGTTAAFGLELGLAFCSFVAAWFILEKPLSR